MSKRRLNEELSARFEVIGDIVSDPSGALVLAREKVGGAEVAIKFVSASAPGDERLTTLFQQAGKLAALDHDGIVRVKDFSAEANPPYVIFEHVDGEALSTLIQGFGALPLRVAVDWTRVISSALSAVHETGLVHGDLTADAVVVTSDETVKVTDFGLVRRGERRTHYTATGMISGTPAYMAPELALGESTSPSSDIYAAGVLLFQMLTANLPFAGSTAADMLLAHVRVPAPDPSSLRPGIPRALAEVVLKALAKKPQERFSSFEELGNALAVLEVEEDEIGRRASLLRSTGPSPDDSGELDPESTRSTRRMMAVSFSGPGGSFDPEENKSTIRMRPPARSSGPPQWEKTVRIKASSTKVTVSWKTSIIQKFAYAVSKAANNETVSTGEEREGGEEHRLEIDGLESGTTYVLRIWDSRDYLNRRFKTPVGML